ncbi:MAG: hypothetical protein Q9202_006741 [Teloschistes flavicans]
MFFNLAVIASLLLASVYLLYHGLRTYRRLSFIPGPFWARFTNLQRFAWVKSKRAHEFHAEQHKKYGDYVRFGPNMVSLSDPSAIATIYPIRPGFPKSDFYKVLMPYTKTGSSVAMVFNTRDEAFHKQIKSPIAALYSLSSTLTHEVFVNQVLGVLFDQLDRRFANTNHIFDLGDWLQYFAFDVMGTLTFSKRYGFLEQGHDVNGMLQAIWNLLDDAASFTQIPWLDAWWRKNRVAVALRGSITTSVLKVVVDCVEERRRRRGDDEKGKQDVEPRDRDMLSCFLEIAENNKSVPPWYV